MNYINDIWKLYEINSATFDSGTLATWDIFLHTFFKELAEKPMNALVLFDIISFEEIFSCWIIILSLWFFFFKLAFLSSGIRKTGTNHIFKTIQNRFSLFALTRNLYRTSQFCKTCRSLIAWCPSYKSIPIKTWVRIW